jgi:hypothetical protein
MVESRRRPPQVDRQSVWLRLIGVSPSDWPEGIIVSVRKPLFRSCQIRIGFVAPFPYESFKTLVFGPDHLHDMADRDRPEHETDHFWK